MTASRTQPPASVPLIPRVRAAPWQTTSLPGTLESWPTKPAT